MEILALPLRWNPTVGPTVMRHAKTMADRIS